MHEDIFYEGEVHKVNLAAHNFKIEDRRRRVASLLAQSMTETEIVQKLNVDQSTISRDIKTLRELSQHFIYDLAKSDLAYYYKQCIDGIEEAKREAWRIYHHNNNEFSVKEKLSALKLIVEANEAKFKLLSEGPSVLAIKSLEERLNKIEIAGQISQ
jgi:DNA-binding transcriptional ArsR family regulator